MSLQCNFIQHYSVPRAINDKHCFFEGYFSKSTRGGFNSATLKAAPPPPLHFWIHIIPIETTRPEYCMNRFSCRPTSLEQHINCRGMLSTILRMYCVNIVINPIHCSIWAFIVLIIYFPGHSHLFIWQPLFWSNIKNEIFKYDLAKTNG